MQCAVATAVRRTRHLTSCLNFPSRISFLSVHQQHRLEPRRFVHEYIPRRSDAQKATIYALSTPPGKAGIAVVRVSGPDALQVWENVVQRSSHSNVEPWRMERCRIVHPVTKNMLDDGLAVYFKAPKSFTTEDVLELHIHSGRAVIASVLDALSHLPYCRPAEPGEFTKRAFLGGRLDLAQVEGLKDLIDAETESQRRLALEAAGGATSARFEELRTGIIRCLAKIEALIDFSEGENLEEGVYDDARNNATKLLTTIRSYLSDNRRGEIMRSGVRLTIFGPPNAGKSSLLNFLARREAAIVTPVPGTTRDILELSLDIGGIPVIISDTAGLRATDDLVEQIGVERARKAIQAADIALCVVSCEDLGASSELPSSVRELVTKDTFMVFNKMDLLKKDSFSVEHPYRWMTSLKTGQGTTEFLAGFAESLRSKYDLDQDGSSSEAPLITHARHRIHLESAAGFIEAFLETTADEVVFGAEELRYAAQAVGKVSGRIDIEDILDSIFRDFCIGK
ncbi:tRNA modification GTPase TrmE [Mycena indigotica]|uniref:tRNA modification GTPase TrmE n=1 Tax=Mycena indigotica TaxID=2126181 RepID=A0A8H6SNN4_9AGAR|nr:tRNA modification GTPase TrmE [Mycena indigotica]KAF7301572.1 tRNA modification GTPase TrmE [Mycena indigotica]